MQVRRVVTGDAEWGDYTVEARVRPLLELVGLAEKHGRYPAELSGGQLQRVTADGNRIPIKAEDHLGHVLGLGGRSTAIEIGDKVVLIAQGDDPATANADLRGMLARHDELVSLGAPYVARMHGTTEVFGREALLMDRYVMMDRDMELPSEGRALGGLDVSLLSMRSVESLKATRDFMTNTRTDIDDLQFLIARDGTFYLADFEGVMRGQQPSEISLRVIDDTIGLAEDPRFVVTNAPTLVMEFVALGQYGPLADPRARLGLNHAFDRQGYLEGVMRGSLDEPHGVFPDMLATADTSIQSPAYDLQKAKQLFDAAGETEGTELTYVTPLSGPFTKPVASAGGALLMGVPDARAPFIADEIEGVARVLPDSRVFLGSDATADQLRTHSGESRFVHIAAHGLFRRDNPMFSSIRLGDGPLGVYDLYQLRLSADLVTLSGCSTGRSAVVGGDELLGLVRGLLYAGARAVLLTLWDAYDRSAADFMTAFYRHLRSGRSKGVAARDAMRELRHAYPHPFYWAPFTLIGDVQES